MKKISPRIARAKKIAHASAASSLTLMGAVSPAKIGVNVRARDRRGAREHRIRIHHLVALIDAEMEMRRSAQSIAGVADVAEEVTALHFHSFVEPGCPAIEVRVVERRAVFVGQPQAVAALRLIADV